ncbi:hypothetical protein BDV93DRAFT_335584 [Ceratobasidium sp. AG-I]|nr:hypothetical protein BDV93DRAFT_335584 [Ceratobasidium sp. AG-I]
MLRFISRHWKFAQRYRHYFNIKRSESSEYTTKADLHALQWLANNARDPRVSDSAYQALAGLRLKHHSEPPAVSSPPTLSLLAQSNVKKKSGRKDKLVTSMFVDVCQRLNQARLVSPHELAASFGVNVARYASTLPHFIAYLNPHPDQGRLAKLVWGRVAKIGAKVVGVQMEAFDPSKTALDALDSVLQDDCPPFTADAYAWITAAELRLVTAITGAIHDHEESVSSKADDGGETLSRSTPAEAVTIDAGFKPATDITLFDLRARYSRALTRASIQMVFHSDGRAPMSAFSLIHLLESIREAARCSALNPPTSLSTHHLQDSQNASILPNLTVVVVGTASSYYLTSGEIGDPDGILGGILNILGASGTYPVAGVENTAGCALEALAPLLLRQWLNLPIMSISAGSSDVDEENKSKKSLDLRPHNSDSPETDLVPGSFFLSLDSWPSTQSLDSDEITGWVLSQILHLAAFAKLYHDRPGVGQLLELSLRAFNMRSKSCYPASLSVWAVQENAQIVRYLATTHDVETIPPHGLESISDHLLRLLAFKYEDCSNFSVSGTDPSDLFRIIQNASTSVPLVERLLVDVSNHGSQDLVHFTRADRGFRRLHEIAERSEYIPAVALCVFDLITKVATPSFNQPSTLAEDDIEAFLGAVTLVLNHPPPNGKKAPNLSLFLSNLFSILESLQGDETVQLVSRYLPRRELEKTLQSNLANSDSKQAVTAGLERYKLGGDVATGA